MPPIAGAATAPNSAHHPRPVSILADLDGAPVPQSARAQARPTTKRLAWVAAALSLVAATAAAWWLGQQRAGMPPAPVPTQELAERHAVAPAAPAKVQDSAAVVPEPAPEVAQARPGATIREAAPAQAPVVPASTEPIRSTPAQSTPAQAVAAQPTVTKHAAPANPPRGRTLAEARPKTAETAKPAPDAPRPLAARSTERDVDVVSALVK